MRVATTEEFDSFVAIRGGVAYVDLATHGCCSGGLRVVEVTMSPPRGAAAYRTFTAGRIRVAVGPSVGRGPDELALEMTGRRRRSPRGTWDGCAFVP